MTNFKDIQKQEQNKDLKQYLQLELISEISIYIEDNNLSLEQLAEMTGMSEEDISDLFAGYIRNFEILSKLLQVLDLRIELTLIKN